MAEIVAKEITINHLPIGLADPGSGTNREDEGDDDQPQQHREDDFEVVLEVALNPRNHGEKTSETRSRLSCGKGEFMSPQCAPLRPISWASTHVCESRICSSLAGISVASMHRGLP